MTQDLVIYLIFIAYAVGMLMTFGTLLTWVERKQAAVMSDRIGANPCCWSLASSPSAGCSTRGG